MQYRPTIYKIPIPYLYSIFVAHKSNTSHYVLFINPYTIQYNRIE
ncbi:MAG: hypothetical protein K0S26_2721 [Bacteroidota bacterium]|nr:hypothetical protein [Bacteroidota bacterium]